MYQSIQESNWERPNHNLVYQILLEQYLAVTGVVNVWCNCIAAKGWHSEQYLYQVDNVDDNKWYYKMIK